MDIVRLLRHLFIPAWRVRTALPPTTMSAIEQAIGRSEATHEGQICFAVEAALDLLPLLRGQSARERAIEVFSELRVWDTEQNNGALIYLLLADHDVEILVDRGIAAQVRPEELESICKTMEQNFREGRFEQGVITGIEALSAHLTRHYPRLTPGVNELPDVPAVL
jgi:uncharacterized membrane protein